MRFYADLHIHSKYSRATSPDCNLENLAFWGAKKGIGVIGTGDFTHPAWFSQIQEKLVPAEPGLFSLKPDLEREVLGRLAPSLRAPVRFMLSVEISTIYKKGDKTRKIHHLIFAPDFEKAARINQTLSRIGNLSADGRPILGLDSRHLLEIVLEGGEDCFLIPAHIWTPWFSLLGSRSGFDRVVDCYGDLSNHIFALETGLSSDPPMNWRVSGLDRYRLVSNSDAHSPSKLGREANLFDCELSYFSILEALKSRRGFLGTAEFFPEEGKYHLDGHRNCKVCLTPAESKASGGICPSCGKPLTLGVLYRVEELADRSEGQAPPASQEFKSLIPLPEILSEIHQIGPNTKGVERDFENLLSKLGSELSILNEVPVEEIGPSSSGLMAEAISRMRQGKVIRRGGYDGEYGVIRLFEPGELKRLEGPGIFQLESVSKPVSKRNLTFSSETRRMSKKPAGVATVLHRGLFVKSDAVAAKKVKLQPKEVLKQTLDPDQQKALDIIDGPLLIIAGPGSGKTRTLTHRIAHLISHHKILPEKCLTITFTKRAAQEMRERLQILLSEKANQIPVLTFHSFGLNFLLENRTASGLPRGFKVRGDEERKKFLTQKFSLSETKANQFLKEISWHKKRGKKQEQARELEKIWSAYHEDQEINGWVDFDDLIALPVKLLEQDLSLRSLYQDRYPWISIDEYQDIDPLQYQLIRFLTPPQGNICAVGDPDQAIYSFRGSDVTFFLRFGEDFTGAKKIFLSHNYRSGPSIVKGASQVIQASSLVSDRRLEPLLEKGEKIVVHRSPTDKAEAEFVVHTIEQLIGGSSFFSIDSGRSHGDKGDFSFSDFVVLYRAEFLAGDLEEAFSRSGIPFKRFSHGLIKNPSSNEGALLTEADFWDPRAETVTLMTLHAAKGLEFRVVFIIGCEEGLLPLQFGAEISKEDLEEERRLFYVGMTRAKESLYLCQAQKRLLRGKIREQSPSPFLQAIEQQLLEKHEVFYKKRLTTNQLNLFGSQK